MAADQRLHRPPTVVLSPPLPPDDRVPDWVPRLAATLGRDGIPVVHPPGAPSSRADGPGAADRLALAGWVADLAVAIGAERPVGPLLLVASGGATRGIPALAMSQRAARHAVAGYVLVDGPLPEAGRGGADWPDAPVLVVVSPDGSRDHLPAAGLRGWRVRRGDPVALVSRWARGWPDRMP